MQYSLILVPIIAVVIAQAIKIIASLIRREFSWREFNRYGGMPSSHTAMMVALVAELLVVEASSAAIAIAIVVAILTIRDALGLRMHLSNHGKILNKLIKELPDNREYKFPYLEERLGHRPWEAFWGAALGIAVSLLYHYTLFL